MKALFQPGSSLDEDEVRPTVEKSQKSFDMKSVGKLAQQILLQEMKTYLPKQYGALSLETMCNACLSLVAYRAAGKTRLTSGSIEIYVRDQNLLEKLRTRIEEFIGTSIENTNWRPMKLSLLSSKL